jgi:flagellar hook-associated protein 3 FlgL
MRVTSEMMVTNSLHRLSTRLKQYERAQSQLATGKMVLNPSDDPARANRGLSLRATLKAREQELRNAADAKSWLDLADSQLQGAMERLHRASDLTVRAASAVDPNERTAIAQEIATIRTELESIANTVHRGRPVFAGFTEGPAVSFEGGTWVSRGDDQVITRRVGESDVVPVNVTAAEIFWLPGGDSMFAMLDRLETSLRGDDGPGIAAELGTMAVARDTLGAAMAKVGANANWVDSAQRRGQEAILSIRGEIAQVEDVDFAQAVMELQMQQVAYEATLQALGRALPPTLAAFLR